MSRLMRTVSRRLRELWGSNTSRRQKPPSTTTRTPSMVSEVSAMGVASTTFRLPAGLGAMAARCSSGASRPYKGYTLMTSPVPLSS